MTEYYPPPFFFSLFFFLVTRMRKLATKNKTVVKGVHLRFYRNNITSKKDIFVQ
jgi:hypothetical protein